MQIIETPVFQFEELDDSAKEKARDWFRSCRDESDFWAILEDFGRVADMLGISLDTHQVTLMGGGTRYDPNIWYDVGYSQSDFAAFDGSYRYRTGAANKVKDYAPTDLALHAVANDLQAIQKRYAYAVTATIKHSDYYGLQVEAYRSNGHELTVEDHDRLKETFRALCRWLYNQLRTEDEYQSADEQVDESIRANEYTFTEDGKRFG
jgi:hypothetical protein